MAAKTGKSILILWCLAIAITCFVGPASADVKVSASVGGQTDVQVTVGEPFIYSIEVTSSNSLSVGEPPAPDFGRLTLINRSVSQSTRSAFVNGQFQTEQSRLFNYVLVAQESGEVLIQGVDIPLDGQVRRTNAVQVRALAGAGRSMGRQPPPQQVDPTDDMDDMEQMFQQLLQRRLNPRGLPQAPTPPGSQGRGGMPQVQPTQPINPNDAFFIQVETDKRRAYVGEQITVSFYLYTRGQVTDIDTLAYPTLRGFWKEDLEMASRLNFEGVMVNGQVYQRALLVSYALFPMRPGRATIDSYKAKCTVLTPTRMGFARPYAFTKVSRPVEIEVLDVPTEGRTSDYSGAVGNFRVVAAFSPSSVGVNQGATLKVKFEGRGNAKLIELPNLNLPPFMEIYDQKSEAKFFRDGTSYKLFEVLIIPRDPGQVELPPVKTSVFDPISKRYEVIQSQPMRLSILGSSTPAPPEASTGMSAEKKKEEASPIPGLTSEFKGRSWWRENRVVVWSALYSMLFAFLGFQTWQTFGRKPKRINLQVLLKRRLASIEEQITKGDVRRVGVELTNAIYFILGQISEQGGANQEVAILLEKSPPSLRKELGQPIQDLLARSEALSFAPEGMLMEYSDKNKLLALQKTFEKVMGRAIEMIDFQDPA